MMMTAATHFEQILDFAHNKIEGFDDTTAKSLLNILGRQLTDLRTRADDVANWPSVSPVLFSPTAVGGICD